jgi:type II secretory pathway component PulC
MTNKIKDFFKFKKKNESSVTDSISDLPDETLAYQIPDETQATKVYVPNEMEDRTEISSLPSPKSFKEKSLHFFSKLFSALWTKSGASKKDWGAIANNILSQETRSSINRLFIISFLLVVTFYSAKMTAKLLKGKTQFNTVKIEAQNTENTFDITQLNQVKQGNPFKTNLITSPKVAVNVRCDESDQKSNLSLKLVNTIVLQDEVKSLASVQVRSDRDLKEFRVGDEIEGMAKIFKIKRLAMIIKNLGNGACEFIESDAVRELRKNISILSPNASKAYKDQMKKMQGIENVGNKFNISKTLLAEKMKDIHTILTQAEAIKIQNPDGSMSFKIVNIEPGSMFSFLGIQNQDIITSINGRPISDINEVMNVFGKLGSLSQLKLGVKREGEEQQLDYQMK